MKTTYDYIKKITNILLLYLVFVSINIFSQSIPESDFENWTKFTQGLAEYYEPSGNWWGSLNKLRLLGAPVTTEQTYDAYSGTSAVKLTTKAWGTLIIPGLLCAGYFDTNQPVPNNLIQGRPYSARPTKAKMYLKYLPINGDTAAIYLSLTKNNGFNKDTIAEAVSAIDYQIGNYSLVEIDFTYYSDAIPDTINIVFASSISGSKMKGHVGSTLFLDKFSLEINNSVIEFIENKDLNISLSNNSISIISKLNEVAIFKIYDISGKLVQTKIINPYESVFLNSLKSGIYVYNFVYNNEYFSNKILIK